MRKATRNYLLFVAQSVAALLLAVSALLLWLVFPRGFFAARALWVDIHKWVGLTLAAMVLLHVALHWSWLVQMTTRYLVSLRALGRQAVQYVVALVQNRTDQIGQGKKHGQDL